MNHRKNQPLVKDETPESQSVRAPMKNGSKSAQSKFSGMLSSGANSACGISLSSLIMTIMALLGLFFSDNSFSDNSQSEQRTEEKSPSENLSALEEKKENQTPQQLYQEGKQLVDSGEFLEAEPLFLKLIEQSPQMAQAYYYLGVISYQTEQPQKAIDYLKTSAELDPKQPGTFYLLGMVLTMQESLEESKSAYHKALELNPKMVQSEHNLGLLYYRTQDWEKSIEHLKRALELDPESENTQFALGLAYIGYGKPEQTMEYITLLRDGNHEIKASALERLLKGNKPPPKTERLEESVVSNKPSHPPVAAEKKEPQPAKASSGKGTISITGSAQVTLKGESAGKEEEEKQKREKRY